MSAEIITPFGASSAPVPDPRVIELAERLLADAKDGTLLALAIAGVTANNHLVGDYAGSGSANDLISAASQMWFRLMRDMDSAT